MKPNTVLEELCLYPKNSPKGPWCPSHQKCQKKSATGSPEKHKPKGTPSQSSSGWWLKAILVAALISLSAHAKSPVDFGRKDVQVYMLGAYAVQSTTYLLLRKNTDMGKLPCYLISAIGTAGASLAVDHWLDKRGYIDRQRQLGAVVGLTFSTIFSLGLDR